MRIIFHVDLDAFFAAVEEIEDPSLKDKPLIVGGRPDQRGVVASANYEAREFGVRAAMPTAQALRRCPKAVVCPPRHELYRAYSKRVMALLRQVSPIIEALSIDEAFLDMTEHIPNGETPLETARSLQDRIQTELDLSASIGIAGNKLVAKIASDFEKPRGLTYISPGQEAEFLAPLPVQSLWGIGPITAQKLNQMGIKTIGDLVRLPETELVQRFGINGARMWRYARGIDYRPVQTSRAVKSISQERTFSQDVGNPQILQKTLQKMSRQLAQRLQKKDFTARTVTLKLRYSDFTTLTRSITRDSATNSPQEIYRQAHHLWQTHWITDRPVRLIGLGVSHFVKGVRQLSLF
jgi:DNA polymerase-4